MKKFRVRHLLLATAALAALMGWLHMKAEWREFRTVVGVDSEVIHTEDGPVSRLFYSRRAGGEVVEVAPLPIQYDTACWGVAGLLVAATVGLWFVRERPDGVITLSLRAVQIMSLVVIVCEFGWVPFWLILAPIKFII